MKVFVTPRVNAHPGRDIIVRAAVRLCEAKGSTFATEFDYQGAPLYLTYDEDTLAIGMTDEDTAPRIAVE